jgi:hypothetical protein
MNNKREMKQYVNKISKTQLNIRGIKIGENCDQAKRQECI